MAVGGMLLGASTSAFAHDLQSLLCLLFPSECRQSMDPDESDDLSLAGGAGLEARANQSVLAGRRRARAVEQASWRGEVMMAQAETGAVTDVPVGFEPPARWAVWSSLQGGQVTGDRYTFDASSRGVFVAAERVSWDDKVLGLGLSTTATDVSLAAGGLLQHTRQIDVLVYGLRTIGDLASFDWGIDYALQDVGRTGNGATADYRGRVFDLYANYRFFGGWGANALGWTVGGTATRQMTPAYEDVAQSSPSTHNDLIQVNTAFEFSQAFGGAELYQGALYRVDVYRGADDLIARNSDGDADEFEVSAGVRVFGQAATLSLGVQWLLGRSSTDSQSWLALVQYQFD